jgi:hypothetical protein
MTETTNRPMRQTSRRECQASGGRTNWLAEQGFEFTEFAAFLHRQDPEWLIDCATRSAHTPHTVGRDARESGDTLDESGSQ